MGCVVHHRKIGPRLRHTAAGDPRARVSALGKRAPPPQRRGMVAGIERREATAERLIGRFCLRGCGRDDYRGSQEHAAKLAEAFIELLSRSKLVDCQTARSNSGYSFSLKGRHPGLALSIYS